MKFSTLVFCLCWNTLHLVTVWLVGLLLLLLFVSLRRTVSLSAWNISCFVVCFPECLVQSDSHHLSQCTSCCYLLCTVDVASNFWQFIRNHRFAGHFDYFWLCLRSSLTNLFPFFKLAYLALLGLFVWYVKYMCCTVSLI